MEIWRKFKKVMDIYRYNMGIRRSFNVFTVFIIEIWSIYICCGVFIMEIWNNFDNFMDIYCYNIEVRRSFNVFMAFIMEIVRILNGFTLLMEL
jgi:hypothetical protein